MHWLPLASFNEGRYVIRPFECNVTGNDEGYAPVKASFFLLERHLAQAAWSLSVLNLICIPQSTHALDQGGVEPRQAVSPRPAGQGRYRFATASVMLQ